MGAGRKTQTIKVPERPAHSTIVFPGNISAPARNLRKSDLGGTIFGCKHNTKDECLSNQLFGLPSPHFSYVRNIQPGLPLFLFNYSDRKLHGIYEAASQGQMYLDQYAWTENGAERTAFPAQVRIRIRMQCQPLTEKQYFDVIKDNYYSEQHFWFELDHAQTKGLIALFKPLPTPRRTIPVIVPSNKTDLFPALPSNKWKAPANSENMNGGAGEHKWGSKLSVGLGNANKFASLAWDDGSSSKTSNSAIEEGEVRETVSDWETDWAGENLQIDGVSQTWPGTWTKLSNDNTPEEIEFKEPVSDLEADLSGKYFQDNHSGVNTHLHGESQAYHGSLSKALSSAPNERDKEPASGLEVDWTANERGFKEPISNWETDWSEENLQHSHSGVGPRLDRETHVSLEHQSVDESFEMVLRKLQKLNAERECSSSKVFIDNNDMPRELQEKMISSKESTVLTDEEKKMAADRSRDILSGEIHEECRLSKEPFVEAEQITTSDPYHGNTELVQIINKLKERMDALEKKQIESDLEMQRLRNVDKESGKIIEELKSLVNELESKLPVVGDTSNKLVKRYLGYEKNIYLIGGFNGTSWLPSLDSFSPSMDLLKPLKPMSSARSYASASALNGNIYVFGGGDGHSWFNSVECYNPRDDEWTSCPHLNCPKGSLAGATLGGKIFAIGGGDGHRCFSDVEMFDPALGRWINIQPMLQKRFAPAAAELHGVLYAVGGYDGNDYLQSVERYDPRYAYWTRLPDMKTRRGCHSLAVLNEKLYALGGYDGDNMVSSVETFDPRLGTWIVDEPMSFARGYSASAVLGDSLFVIGGLKEGNHIMDTVECYKEGTGWSATGLKSVGTRCFFSAIVL